MSQSIFPSYQADNISSYLSYIRSLPLLTEEEEYKLTNDVYYNHNVASAQKLVLSHLKLVAKIASRMNYYGLAVIDLIGEGTVGLMHAVRKYNPTIGARFSTYASWWIKAHIHEYIIKSWSLVKIGTTMAQKKLFFHLKKAKAKILLTHNKGYLSDADCKTIAKELSVSSSDVKEMDIRLISGVSLDAPIGNDDDADVTMLDHVVDQRQNTEEVVSKREIASKQSFLLNEAISFLNTREAEIVKLRHLSDKPQTLEVLSNKYKLSRERVRQIEKVALDKITQYCRNEVRHRL